MSQSWLDDLIAEYEEDVETPRSWLWWGLLSAISAVAANNYEVIAYNGKHIYKPNLYVMLLGKSGLGKALPTTLAKLLVDAADVTRVIAGRSSIQAIVQELGTSRTSPNGKPPYTDARAFIVNGELSTALIKDPDALSILTDLYDGSMLPKWTNLLKGEGAKPLSHPYITALFGSSPAHFYDSIPQANIEGGYIGRNLIVYEEKRARELDMLGSDEMDYQLEKYILPKYSQHLINIAKNKCKMIPTQEAKNIMNQFKKDWRVKDVADTTGFVNRVPDHSMKVAMCIALSRYDFNETITEEDINLAISKVTGLMYANRVTTEARGLDPQAAQTKMVLNFLIAAPENKLTKKQLLTKGLGNYKTAELDTILETLIEVGYVRRERIVAGTKSDWMIYLAGEPLESYKKFKAS